MSENLRAVRTSDEMHPSTQKREKFVRLAESRTIRAIRAIRVIGKLGNRSAYAYTDSDVAKIVKALNQEIEALRGRFRSSEQPNNIEFKL